MSSKSSNSSSSSSGMSAGKIALGVIAAGAVIAGAAYLLSGSSSNPAESPSAGGGKKKGGKKVKSPNNQSTDQSATSPTVVSPQPKHSPSSSSSFLSQQDVPSPTTSPKTVAGGFLGSQQGGDAQKSYGKLAAEAAAKGQYPKAVELFSLAIQEQDTNNKLYTNRANVYVKMKRFEDALRDATKSLMLAQSASAYLAKGAAHAGLEQYEQAVVAFEAAIVQEDATDAHKTNGRKSADDAVRKLTAQERQAADALASSIPAPVTQQPKTPEAVAEHGGQSYAAALAAAEHKSYKETEAALEQDNQATAAFRKETGSTANVALASSSIAPTPNSVPAPSSAGSSHGGSEVEFNPDHDSVHSDSEPHSGEHPDSEDSNGSGVMIQHSDAQPSSEKKEKNEQSKLASSSTLKESAVFVSPADLSASSANIGGSPTNRLSNSALKSGLQTALGRKQQKKVFHESVEQDLVAQASRKQNRQKLSALGEEVKNAGGKSPLKKSPRPASKTFTASQTASFSSPSASASSPSPSPEVVYNSATMHPSMLTASAVLTSPSSAGGEDASPSAPAVGSGAEESKVSDDGEDSSKPARGPRGGRRAGKRGTSQANVASPEDASSTPARASSEQQGTPNRRNKNASVDRTPNRRQPSVQMDSSSDAASSGPAPLTPVPAAKTGWAARVAASAEKK